jgi:hypothetical protein
VRLLRRRKLTRGVVASAHPSAFRRPDRTKGVAQQAMMTMNFCMVLSDLQDEEGVKERKNVEAGTRFSRYLPRAASSSRLTTYPHFLHS